MIIGVPKEIKEKENRIALTPSGVKILHKQGHKIYIEKDAGLGASLSNDSYIKAGAQLLDTAEEIWGESDMVMKVKEPLPKEFSKNNILNYHFLKSLHLGNYLHF